MRGSAVMTTTGVRRHGDGAMCILGRSLHRPEIGKLSGALSCRFRPNRCPFGPRYAEVEARPWGFSGMENEGRASCVLLGRADDPARQNFICEFVSGRLISRGLRPHPFGHTARAPNRLFPWHQPSSSKWMTRTLSNVSCAASTCRSTRSTCRTAACIRSAH